MRERIRRRQYVVTFHAEEEMNDDGLTIYDVERCILTGDILERQRDQLTAEWKYLLGGKSLGGGDVELVAKIGATGRLVIITVYLVGEPEAE